MDDIWHRYYLFIVVIEVSDDAMINYLVLVSKLVNPISFSMVFLLRPMGAARAQEKRHNTKCLLRVDGYVIKSIWPHTKGKVTVNRDTTGITRISYDSLDNFN